MDRRKLSRRTFLRLSAVAAGSLALMACGGASGTSATPTSPSGTPTHGTVNLSRTAAIASPTTRKTPALVPTPTPGASRFATPESYAGEYHEAPMLAELVKAGKLPPVEQRLPKHPYVVPHKWVQQGKYGGVLNTVCNDASDWGTTHLVQEMQYGHSPLRWLNDGLTIGPGIVESWEANEDQTVWTFHFREGLRWSDGHPWTVDDIMFWWEDEVGVPELNEPVPTELRAGDGSLPKLRKVDDYTLQLIYGVPAPLLAEYLCTWVKRGIGPRLMDPKHYLAQFHIKYNKGLDRKKWVDQFHAKQDWATNPDSPTLTGWRLREYKKGQYSLWERNPYYWCIDRWGNQLPYIDRIVMRNVQDPELMRLQIQQGKYDFVHGAFVGLSLADVSTFRSAGSGAGIEVYLWDSGTGAGSAFWFNIDYREDKMRNLIREPKFRQALSFAFNRDNVQRLIYFNTGEQTTGTMSPKAGEFHISGGQEVYRSWRDSYVRYDPTRAKKLLDELGVVDRDGDGWREFPDGSKLLITLDYPATASQEHIRKDELLSKDWQAVGINARMNPVPPVSWDTLWRSGRILSQAAWTSSDGPSLLLYSSNFVPASDAGHWAPLHTQYYQLRGTPQAERGLNDDPWRRSPPRIGPRDKAFYSPVGKMWELWDAARRETDAMRRGRLVWEIVKLHVQYGPLFMGSVANAPYLEVIKTDLKNVPRREDLQLHGYVEPWIHPTPAVYDPESWYWANPEAHAQ